MPTKSYSDGMDRESSIGNFDSLGAYKRYFNFRIIHDKIGSWCGISDS